MNFRNIGIIISREYSTRVHKRSFLVITFAAPIVFLLICLIPVAILAFSHDKMQTVEVVDESGIVMPYLESGGQITYTDRSDRDLDDLKAGMKDDGADAVLHISAIDPGTKNVSVEIFSLKALTVDLVGVFQSRIGEAVEDYRIASYDIPDLKEIMEGVKPEIPVATYTVNEDGGEKASSTGVFMFISVFFSIFIFMFIQMFSGMVMSGVIEEKSSKVVEVLTSSVKSTELMFGKIIGVAGVALTQFLLWIALIAVIVFALGKFGVFNALMGPDTAGQMAQMSSMPGMDGMGDMAGIDITAMAGIDPAALADAAPGADAATGSAANSGIAAILSTLRDLNYGQIILSFIAFFFLGYLLYASLFGAIGSAVDNEADTNQLQLPVTSPLMIGFFIAIYVFKSPDSGLAVFGSLFPLTSPIVMMARVPFGVPGWQLALSIVLLLLTFVFCAWLSAKIYRVGILTSGKKTTFKDLWKWLRQK